MSTEEITSNIALIVGGGGETTRGAPSSTCGTCCCSTPSSSPAVVADDALWDAAFHETLRCATLDRRAPAPPQHASTSSCTGCAIPAGSLVHMVDFSANHDERIFAEPERFDIFRPDLYSGKILRSGHHKEGQRSHMAFGVGPHLCPGAWISPPGVGARVAARRHAHRVIPTHRRRPDAEGHRRREPGADRSRCHPRAVARLRPWSDRAHDQRYDAATPSRARAGYRTYEVYQRERLGESTPLIKPRPAARAAAYLDDPYPVLAILRENYPCYRDWPGNAFWLTRYDDVTSVFVDDANFETRSKLWHYGLDGLRPRPAAASCRCWSPRPRGIDEQAGPAGRGASLGRAPAERRGRPRPRGRGTVPDRAAGAGCSTCPRTTWPASPRRYWAMQRGVHWEPVAEEVGRARHRRAGRVLRARWSRPDGPTRATTSSRPSRPLELDGGPATAEDVVVTLLEGDHETLPRQPGQPLVPAARRTASSSTWSSRERRMVKLAYLEALRHSPPVLAAHRYARHEVERFGRLLPEGAQVDLLGGAPPTGTRGRSPTPTPSSCSARTCASASRAGSTGPTACRRASRSALGPPSKHPALPEDRPRSLLRHLPRHRGDGDEPAARRAPRTDAGPWCQPDAAVAARRRDAHLLAPAGVPSSRRAEPCRRAGSAGRRRLQLDRPALERPLVAASEVDDAEHPVALGGLADHVAQHAGRSRVVGRDEVVAASRRAGRAARPCVLPAR